MDILIQRELKKERIRIIKLVEFKFEKLTLERSRRKTHDLQNVLPLGKLRELKEFLLLHIQNPKHTIRIIKQDGKC